MKILISFLITLYSTYSYATDQFINVFAIVDNSASGQVHQINQTMKNRGIYKRYSIKPFSDRHLVHMTMYLTHYNDDKVSDILEQVSKIATSTNQFSTKTKGLELKASNFLMLNVENNDAIQNLSNLTVTRLSPYRNKNINITAYAKNDPVKVDMFEKYGSPSVFNQFEPHFSIFSATVSKNKQIVFQQNVNRVIADIIFPPQDITVIGLGVGLADINGQITKVIKTYKLS